MPVALRHRHAYMYPDSEACCEFSAGADKWVAASSTSKAQVQLTNCRNIY